jgi:adenylate cyclase
VSPQIVSALLNSDRDPAAPQRITISVVFADLRNFTDFCTLAPLDAVHQVCNEFFDMCSMSMSQTGATLDKFVGDQVMALFGAPLAQGDHAVRAVYFGILLQHGVARLRESWIKQGLLTQQVLDSKPNALQLGVGVNTGEMIVGLFGNEKTGQYTALGHGVNLCARLCSNAGGGQILAGMGTLDEIKKAHASGITMPFKAKFKPGEPVSVKGIEQPVQVVQVLW